MSLSIENLFTKEQFHNLDSKLFHIVRYCIQVPYSTHYNSENYLLPVESATLHSNHNINHIQNYQRLSADKYGTILNTNWHIEVPAVYNRYYNQQEIAQLEKSSSWLYRSGNILAKLFTH